MYVRHLSLADFRSWAVAELPLRPGPTAIVGANGQGKTNLVEALNYLSTLSSHRVGTDAPLVRAGASAATVRAAVVSEARELRLEITITPGKTNRARINTTALPRARELLGVLQTVMFAPEDLAIVRGDPTERRRFLDDLLIVRSPALAGVRSDYDRTVKQRTALLKSAGAARRAGRGADLSTLDVWDGHLAAYGAQLTAARLTLLDDLRAPAAAAYAALAPGAQLGLDYRFAAADQIAGAPSPGSGDVAGIEALLLEALATSRAAELERGVTLVGPHRDDVVLQLGDLPVRGYASHGESWSVALALRLGSLDVLREGGAEPVLVLDDVFAELDAARRDHLVQVARSSEQVLITAAVASDVPDALAGDRVDVRDGALSVDSGSGSPGSGSFSVSVDPVEDEGAAGRFPADEAGDAGQATPPSTGFGG